MIGGDDHGAVFECGPGGGEGPGQVGGADGAVRGGAQPGGEPAGLVAQCGGGTAGDGEGPGAGGVVGGCGGVVRLGRRGLFEDDVGVGPADSEGPVFYTNRTLRTKTERQKSEL
nr:hypothetical protein [Streptomyces europaeiscabiei]